MGFAYVKQLDSQNYNRKLFYLDRGAIDLPPIVNFTDIVPGSECRSLLTGEKWVLNTHYKWIYIDENWCGCCGGTGGSSDGGGDTPITPGEEPTIEGIKLTPANVTVGPGAKISFTAEVEGDPALSRGVTWTIKGQNSHKTQISPDGILTVGDNEKAKAITVRVTSQLDPKVFAQAVVTVDQTIEDPTIEQITGITLNPKNIECILGRAVAFQATVSGVNVSDFGVVYSITGQENANTYIEDSGILHVAADEPTRIITVKVVSKADARFWTTAVVSVVSAEDAKDPDNIAVTSVTVIPANASVGKGYSAQFAAQVKGTGTPSQEVVWRISGHTSPDTRITSMGTLYVGEDETTNLITITAQPIYAPEFIGEAEVVVLEADAPGVADKTVDAIIITPDMCELEQGKYIVYKAVVIGKNNPSQAVTWELRGATVQTTYISEQGTLVIGIGETAESLQVVARSVQDKSKYNVAYVSVARPDLTPVNGIPEVPESPFGTKYVRERDENGRAVWTPVKEKDETVDPGPAPEIKAIYVTPEAATVAPGSTVQFMAEKEGSEELSDSVTWAISGHKSAKTLISSDGLLIIGDDETSRIIKVKATSTVDTSKSGSATISVDKDAPVITEITGIYLIPADAEVVKGKGLLFQTVLTGINVNNKEVTYALQGNLSANTTLSDKGALMVGADESSPVLIITSTSVANPAMLDSSVVSVIPPELEEDPVKITSIQVLPTYTNVGRGMNAKFGVQIVGVNNPPADVLWEVFDAESNATHISRDGTLYIGADEVIKELKVRATPIYDPTIYSEATANVVSEDTPGIGETTVDAVIISPPTAELAKGDRLVLKATVIGKNDPSQEVRWTVEGNGSTKTVITKTGVLTVSLEETARVLKVNAVSVADGTKMSTAYITLTEAQVLPDTGIEDVPEAPLDTEWLRYRDENGKTYWKQNSDQYLGEVPAEPLNTEYNRKRMPDGTVQWVEDTGGGRPDTGTYMGTFETYEEMMAAGIPEDAIDGDFVYVKDDSTHGRCPAMYEIRENEQGVLEYRFAMTFGRPPILGDKLDILFVLDNGVHSTLIKDIEVLDDFDQTEERYELYQSPSAWKLVTELHPGFWSILRRNGPNGWYKMIVGMANEDGFTRSYLTAFTDEHEFEHYIEEEVINPDPIQNTLTWTNTVGKANTFTASDGTKYRHYEYDPQTGTMKVVYEETIPPDTEPGVSPWATVVGEYTLLANGEVIGPLAGVTDPTGYIWVSDHERFMIGSAGDGTQMFCYNIETDEWFIFDTPAGNKNVYQMATDIHERYFMMFINADTFIWGDVQTKTTRIGVWSPDGYTGLSTPDPLTRPSISTNGLYYLHTSTNPNTPAFTTFRFEDGEIATEGPVKGTSSSSIGLDSGLIFTNTPEGEISIYRFDEQTGAITRLHKETPYECRYVVQFTMENNQVLCVKVEDKANCPIWFVYSANDQRIIAESANTADYCQQTNPQGKGCVYELDVTGGERYLISLENNSQGYVVQFTGNTWIEVGIPFGGLENNQHQYNQPILMSGGDILITQDETGKAVGFDLVNMVPVELEDILNPGGDPHLVQIDAYHMMWCTDNGSQLIYVADDGTQKVILEIPEQQVLVYGFGDIERRGKR